MASDEVLIVRRESQTVIATLNRPEKMNALNKDLLDEIKELLDVLTTDRSVRTLVFTGAGEKSFCVGADLKERQSMNEKDVILRLDFVRQLYLRLEKLPFPVIAAINGMALGGGFELALACDLRVASEIAILGFPEVELAIIPGNGGTQRITRHLSLSRSLELILLAKRLTATEAHALGLINWVVPAGHALIHALSWATRIGEMGPVAIRQAKSAIRMGYDRSIEEGLQLEVQAYHACLYSKDRLEGLKAFSEKRKPKYLGE